MIKFRGYDNVEKIFYNNKEDGAYNLTDNLCVVISLTDKYNITNKYYKMVAQLFY